MAYCNEKICRSSGFTMSGLTLKRLFMFTISMVLGFLTGWAIITIGFSSLPLFSSIETSQSRTIVDYGYQYFFWTFAPIGVVYMIWLDMFMDTGILPD